MSKIVRSVKRLNLSRLWEAPLNLAHEIRVLVGQTIDAWVQDSAIRMAAALAFYTIFSIGPALLIALFVAETMVDAASARLELATILDRFVTPGDTAYVFSLLESAKGKIAGTGFPALSVITAIIAATGVFTELQSGLNAIWKVRSQRGSSVLRYIEMRFISFLIVLGIGVLLLASLAATTVSFYHRDRNYRGFPNFRQPFVQNQFTDITCDNSSPHRLCIQVYPSDKNSVARRLARMPSGFSAFSAGQIYDHPVPEPDSN